MISVRPSEVPKYLRSGDFYPSLDLRNDDAIDLHGSVIKPDTIVNDSVDAINLLQSLRFWGVPRIPFESIDIILSSPEISLDPRFDDAFPELPLIRMLQSTTEEQSRLLQVVELGSAFLLEYLVERGVAIDASVSRLAFDLGHIDCLEYLHKKGLLDDLRGHAVVMHCATQNRISVPNLATLKYALRVGCTMDAILMDSAAQTGMLDVLKFAFEHGIPFTPATPLHIVAHGHLECLQWYHEVGGEWSITVTIMAASSGALDCLKYACEHGCDYDAHTALRAAYNNQLSCLQYLHSIGCPWDENVAIYAALRGNLQCLQYAHECGCPIGCRAHAVAKLHEHSHCVHYLEINSITSR